MAGNSISLASSTLQPPVARTSSDTLRLCTHKGRPGGQTSSLKTCMAGDCQTRGIPSRKRPGKPPATRQRWGCESGCGLNRRWPSWKPIHGPNHGVTAPTCRWRFAIRHNAGSGRCCIQCTQAPPSGDVAYMGPHPLLSISVKSASNQRLISGSKRVGEVPDIRERGVNAPAYSRNHGADAAAPYPFHLHDLRALCGAPF